HPRRAVWMALAGPAANLVLVLLAALLIRVGLEWGFFEPPYSLNMSHITDGVGGRFSELCAALVSIVFSLNLLLLTFNLLPLPPLDGSNIPFFFLSPDAAEKYRALMWNPTVQVIGLLVAFRGFGKIFPLIQDFAVNLLYPGISYS
ncbi:MAG: hypothetical protein V4710_04820, partial [Verrucomicrobiota bacterium]